MKKLPYLVLAVVLLWGAFSVHQVSAATIYQQLTDSSGELQGGHGGDTVLVGTFTTTQDYTFTSSGFAYGVFRNNGSPVGPPEQVEIDISIDSACQTPFIRFATSSPPADNNDYFLELPKIAGTTLTAGTWYVCFDNYNSSYNYFTRTNLSEDFWYGYITTDGTQSVPVAPGIPGFTDVGISTTSQQVYCNQNFSTSSGLLDSLGQSIALGACNVGVFLFVPSQSALSQFYSLSSTSQSKIPFSYYYGIKNIFYGLTASSTENLPNWSIPFPNLSSTTPLGSIIPTTIPILSTSTIDKYYPTAIRETVLTLASFVIWVLVALVIYRRIVPNKAL